MQPHHAAANSTGTDESEAAASSTLPAATSGRHGDEENRPLGRPVVHFEIIGRDGERLRAYYGALFGWRFDTANPMDYGLVAREDNTRPDGTGIGGGVGSAPNGYAGHVTFYVDVPDVEAALEEATRLGGRRVMGPHTVGEGIEIGQFVDPEGHLVGVLRKEDPRA